MGYQPTRANMDPKPPSTGRASMTNCPNCDALLSYEGGLHCDYCGAVFERPERYEEETVLYSDGAPYFSIVQTC